MIISLFENAGNICSVRFSLSCNRSKMSFSFQWENITVTVVEKHTTFFKTKEKKRVLINNVSGFASSGSLIAVMGPSGCGKTTLLGAISGKIKGKQGVVRINNQIITNEGISAISGYVQQADIFTESLTIYEHMKFMTTLKLHKTEIERNATIKKLLSELSLEINKYTTIRVLSGGERRRLSLATELISDPLVLFCDEPTTGLDSFSAMSVIKILEATALSGKVVLVTVHQPSSQIFDLFNNIILLSNGKLIFEGTKQQAKVFFERANLYCPVTFNLADFYIKCVTINPHEEEKGEREINRLSQQFRNEFQITANFIDKFGYNGRIKENVPKKKFLIQLKWLIWRVFIDSRRNMSRYWTSYMLLMTTAVTLSIAFSNVTLDDSSSPQNIQGALILMVTEVIFSHMYYVIYVFPGEVTIFVWEKSLYSSVPYFISKLLSLVPVCLMNAASFVLIFFTGLQFLQGFDLFLSMFGILFMISFCASCFGLCLSAVFSSAEHIDVFIVPVEFVVMIVSGMWIKIDTLPVVFRILKYFSPFYYGFQSMSYSFWHRIDHLANCTSADALPCYKNGEEVLKRYGFFQEYDVVAYDGLFLCLLILLYCVIGFVGIVRKRALFELY